MTVGEVAAAIIVGGGGTSILNNLFRQSQKINADKKTMSQMVNLIQGESEDENATRQ